ncbi:glycosyltransferase family 4 protein [Podospora appendiculata]|uniref:Alpha-1,3/1,6-mannosyltransferase ALG2 n=1 Tax=Podospora appendiculata TaxID=314037 RepID=A0AAE0X317_9PEZI|nr:glycosyltransferase family 4 protein [Podospora appendiculata]
MPGDDNDDSDDNDNKRNERKRTIVFLHPDLGIGGAERLVVDAAVALQKRGHRVVIFTSHCDPRHCFDEARDGTLDVRVRGNTLVPPSVLGRFAILCAILRQLHLILHITLFTSELVRLAPSAFFVDQLSAGLPLLARLAPPRTPILFYCHFPDLLLAQGRDSLPKRLYRIPFDALEQWSMAAADAIAVNSRFTKAIVAATWPALTSTDALKVVYPCVDTTTTTTTTPPPPLEQQQQQQQQLPWPPNAPLILSINRFERKKNIALAIRAFAGLPPTSRNAAKLLIAGGYDSRVSENVTYHADLEALCTSLHLRSATAKTLVTALNLPADVHVVFLLSVPHALKELLLARARLLVYTPANEHFGIVPLEAMLRGVPVLAADTGGPTETVVEGVTGWLRDPEDVPRWTEVMDRVLNRMSEGERARIGAAGVERVKGQFAEAQMGERLDEIFDEMEGRGAGSAGTGRGSSLPMMLAGAAVAVFVALVAVVVSTVLGR